MDYTTIFMQIYPTILQNLFVKENSKPPTEEVASDADIAKRAVTETQVHAEAIWKLFEDRKVCSNKSKTV